MLPLLLAVQVAAAADTTVYPGDQGRLRVPAPRVEAPSIRVDGQLDEPEWSRAAVLNGFTRFEPLEGGPASQPTDVLVFYSADAMYFGIRAYDSEPDRIRASLTERDQGVFDDDWVRITLDTFHDSRQAYAFYVNPRGIQADGLWLEGSEQGFGPPIDFNPDFIWESDGRVTSEGWAAEIRIPYVSLRFREVPSQTWGLNVARQIQRNEWSSSWAPLTEDAANWLALSGELMGLEGLRPRRLMEVNPVATGRRVGELRDDGEFARDDFEPDFGINARLGVTQNLVLDGTINPDFSQVETDADQVAVNERFALFFPEKRPFFLEGTEIFNTPQQLVYTRAIVDPIGGAKLTGKMGALNVGYLGAVDESPVTFDQGEDEALFNLVRVRRDVGSGSTVGGLYTDRTLLGGSEYNRVGSLDTRLVLAGRYTVTAQVAGAWSREPGDDPAGDIPLEPETLFGPLLSAEVERSGVHFSWNAGIEDVHPDFRARSGFIRRVGDTEVEAEAQYTFYADGDSFLEDWSPELSVQAFFDHDDFWAGRRYHEAEVEAALDFSLRGPNGGNFQVARGYFAFDPADYSGYEQPVPGPGGGQYTTFTTPAPLDALWSVGGFGRARPLPWLSFSGRAFYRRVPIHAEAARGTELSLGPEAQIRFPWGLLADLSFEYSRIVREDHSRFSIAQIPRLKVQYQLTRALFARGILQYNLQDRDALRSPSGQPLRIDGVVSEPMDEGEVQYDLLLAYEPSPGTVVYAGWTRVREGPNTYRFGDLTPVSEGLFLKVSYLFRL